MITYNRLLAIFLILLSVTNTYDIDTEGFIKDCNLNNPSLPVPLKINLWIAQRRSYIVNTIKPYEDKIILSGKTIEALLDPIIDNVFAYANDLICMNSYIELEVDRLLSIYN